MYVSDTFIDCPLVLYILYKYLFMSCNSACANLHIKLYVMLCYVMLCYVMLCYVMLCYVMLCYVILCYVMLCYVNYIYIDPPRNKINPRTIHGLYSQYVVGVEFKVSNKS